MPISEEQRKKFANFKKDPNYVIKLVPHPGTVQAVRNGKVIAKSERAIDLLEPNHMAVVYFPRDDVDFALLEATDHATHCPYKGEASYWSITGSGGTAENALWSYETPIQDVAGIKDYVAFYTDDMGADFGIVVSDTE